MRPFDKISPRNVNGQTEAAGTNLPWGSSEYTNGGHVEFHRKAQR